MQTMKALAVTEIGKRAELMEMPRPQADENSIVIKTVYSGISIGTEMWIAEGRRSDYGEPPFINGYQASGRVVEVGAGGKGQYEIGDWVTVFCNGAHAEYVKANLRFVHKLGKAQSLKACSMFVQPSVAANAWDISSNVPAAELLQARGTELDLSYYRQPGNEYKPLYSMERMQKDFGFEPVRSVRTT